MEGTRDTAAIARGWSRALLFLLAAILPFELASAWFSLGPISITSVELVLYLTLGFWALGVVVSRRLTWSATHWAVFCWSGVVIASGLAADQHQAAALKFGLRAISGCLLFVAVADLVTSARQVGWLLVALTFGAAISAVCGVLEITSPTVAQILSVFKTQPSFAGGLLRASGTFQYANTASMYWECALALALTAGAWLTTSGHGRLWRWAGTAIAILLGLAIILSASRAGLLITAVVLITVAFTARTARDVRVPAILALLVLVPSSQFGPAGLVALRFQDDDFASWLRARWIEAPTHLTIDAGGYEHVSVTIKNEGILPWPSSGENAVAVSYHWATAAGDRILIYDGIRSPLPFDVRPGQEVTVATRVSAPVPRGEYTLQWDLVREGITWFSALGAPLASARVIVEDERPTTVHPPLTASAPIRPLLRPPRLQLWRAAWEMWTERPLLGVGPDNFRVLYGPYLRLSPFDDRVTTNNLYLEILATLGMLGLITFLAIILNLGRRWWHWCHSVSSVETRLLGLGLAVALAAFLVHGFVDYFLEFTPTYGLFWILCGAGHRAWSLGSDHV